MVKLIHGKGQLGEALKKAEIISDWTIYHTWDMRRDDFKVQKKCYEDFVNYVDKHPDEKILFISTITDKQDPYKKFKRLAEIYLQAVHKEYKIINLCGIIGKGVCEGFRKNQLKPFGEMKLITLNKAVIEIFNFLQRSERDCQVYGYEVPAGIVNELIQFGKNGTPTK